MPTVHALSLCLPSPPSLFCFLQYLLHRNLTGAAEALGIDCAKAGLPMVDDAIEPRFTSTPEALQIAVRPVFRIESDFPVSTSLTPLTGSFAPIALCSLCARPTVVPVRAYDWDHCGMPANLRICVSAGKDTLTNHLDDGDYSK